MSKQNQSLEDFCTDFDYRKSLRFSAFLKLLLEANEYSVDLATSPWEFALGFDEAILLNLNPNDLYWMLRKEWIQCRGLESHGHSQGCPALPTFCPSSKFIILNKGKSAFRRANGGQPPSSNTVNRSSRGDSFRTSVIPIWDTARRELKVLGKVVKRFRWPAPNQETIISVFAEDGWPPKIEDPLPRGHGLDPKRRLGDTIKCLNRNQQADLIRFRGDGTGEGVLWDINSVATPGINMGTCSGDGEEQSFAH